MAEPIRPRIFRLTVERADGSRRSRLVKAPYYEREPRDSIYGLHARLAELEEQGVIVASTVRAPADIGPIQRKRLERWPAVLESMLEVAS